MIHKIDPRQKRLFDSYQGLITPAGLKIIAVGWQGLLRHILLEKMPFTDLATNSSKIAGASTKELYFIAGIVFLADFIGWLRKRSQFEPMAEAIAFRIHRTSMPLTMATRLAARRVEEQTAVDQ